LGARKIQGGPEKTGKTNAGKGNGTKERKRALVGDVEDSESKRTPEGKTCKKWPKQAKKAQVRARGG